MPQDRSPLPKPGLLGAGFAVRIAVAASVVILLWIATAWAVADPAAPPPVPPPVDRSAASIRGE